MKSYALIFIVHNDRFSSSLKQATRKSHKKQESSLSEHDQKPQPDTHLNVARLLEAKSSKIIGRLFEGRELMRIFMHPKLWSEIFLMRPSSSTRQTLGMNFLWDITPDRQMRHTCFFPSLPPRKSYFLIFVYSSMIFGAD